MVFTQTYIFAQPSNLAIADIHPAIPDNALFDCRNRDVINPCFSIYSQADSSFGFVGDTRRRHG
ncbi:hypothetical protein N9B71_03705, partial [Pirellulales bacterium]|nr:hypothetical protein [Pirellulales bacterium]